MARKMKERLSEAVGIPKEISMDYPKLTMLGNSELYIDNFKAVIEYTPCCIRLGTSVYFIKIGGNNMEIKNISPETLEIKGDICSMEISR